MRQKTFLYVWDDRFLYAGPGFQSGPTSRYAATGLYTIDGPALRVRAQGEADDACGAVLVAPHVTRTLDAAGCTFLSLNLDPHSYEYHALAHLTGASSRCCRVSWIAARRSACAPISSAASRTTNRRT